MSTFHYFHYFLEVAKQFFYTILSIEKFSFKNRYNNDRHILNFGITSNFDIIVPHTPNMGTTNFALQIYFITKKTRCNQSSTYSHIIKKQSDRLRCIVYALFS